MSKSGLAKFFNFFSKSSKSRTSSDTNGTSSGASSGQSFQSEKPQNMPMALNMIVMAMKGQSEKFLAEIYEKYGSGYHDAYENFLQYLEPTHPNRNIIIDYFKSRKAHKDAASLGNSYVNGNFIVSLINEVREHLHDDVNLRFDPHSSVKYKMSTNGKEFMLFIAKAIELAKKNRNKDSSGYADEPPSEAVGDFLVRILSNSNDLLGKFEKFVVRISEDQKFCNQVDLKILNELHPYSKDFFQEKLADLIMAEDKSAGSECSQAAAEAFSKDDLERKL